MAWLEGKEGDTSGREWEVQASNRVQEGTFVRLDSSGSLLRVCVLSGKHCFCEELTETELDAKQFLVGRTLHERVQILRDAILKTAPLEMTCTICNGSGRDETKF